MYGDYWRRCVLCGHPFPGKGNWVNCPPCRKVARRERLDSSDNYANELHFYYRVRSDVALREENARLRRQLAEMHAAKLDAPTTSGLDPAFVTELLKLCHPDRHANRTDDLANRVTKRLLAMRAASS